jgi:hypothetical protein
MTLETKINYLLGAIILIACILIVNYFIIVEYGEKIKKLEAIVLNVQNNP